MKELLENYSFSEILIFLFMLFIAAKEFITIFDWVKARISQSFNKESEEKEERKKMQGEIDDLEKFYDEKKIVDDGFKNINESVEKLNILVAMLIDSDKESIKAFITDKHHFFVYDQGWIDDYSMDCLEKRYAIYEKEHGNSFAEDLMNELRNLPKRPRPAAPNSD